MSVFGGGGVFRDMGEGLMERLLSILKSLVARAFYGQVVVKFEAGKVTIIEVTEKVKP